MWLFLVALLKLIEHASTDTCTWDNCPKWSNDPSIWNVHFIPHTHDDLGWLMTADQYYIKQVQFIFNTMTQELAKDPNKRFTYCETGYLKRWLEDYREKAVDILKPLIQNGQLEILGGGWVQPDEAATHYIDLIDLYTLGLRTLNDTFGPCTQAKTAWQIDPFGHSREHANLMSMMGYESLWFAREHYLEHINRRANKALEMMWHTSDDNDNQILTGLFYQSSKYSAPMTFSFDILNPYGGEYPNVPIQDNPLLDNYNVNERLGDFMNYLNNMSLTQQHNHYFVLMGDDFNYQDANMYFTNLDKLIFHLNQNLSSKLVAAYSTPSCYVQAIKNISSIVWPNKTADFFPYANEEHAYWTGYFTSKPAFKGLIRKSSALLQLTRQLSSIALTSWSTQTNQQIEVLERAAALAQHHDAVTGTSKEFVTQNYIQRLLKGWTSVEQVLNNAIQTVSQNLKNNNVTLPIQMICRNINESDCDFTKNNNVFTVTVFNGNSQSLTSLVKIPLYQNSNNLNITDAGGNIISYEITNVFNNPGQINNSNISPFEIRIVADVPPVGFKTYFVSMAPSSLNNFDKNNENIDAVSANSISNGLIQLEFDANGYISTFTDLSSGQSYPLKQQFFYYHGHDKEIGQRASGAYMFRPQEQTPYNFTGSINLSIFNGSLVKEARQIISPWVSQVIRLLPNKSYGEFEWTVGPIPKEDNISKEVITTYTINGLNTNGTFWTDANGRQLMKRIRNYAPDYTFVGDEPVAANYYPIDSRILISDGTTSLAVLTDRSEGGGSINDGQVEIMLHRRDFYDDGFGVSEPLNEPGRDGRGLVVRGKHWLILGNSSYTSVHRKLAYEMFHAPIVTFSSYTSNNQYAKDFITDFSGVQQALPENIHLLTLKQIASNNFIIRLEHIYQKDEDEKLSKPATLDLTKIVVNFKIAQVQELSLAANKVLNANAGTSVTLAPMDIKTYLLTLQSGNNGNTTASSNPTATTSSGVIASSVSTSTNTLQTTAKQGASSSTINILYNMDFYQAEYQCKWRNGHLPSIHSVMENYLVHNLTYDGYPCPSYSYQYFCEYWIGLHNPYRDGVWRWTDGSDYDFKAWQDGSPTSGLCAVLYHNRVQSIISWYDSACSGQERRILCEITPLKK